MQWTVLPWRCIHSAQRQVGCSPAHACHLTQQEHQVQWHSQLSKMLRSIKLRYLKLSTVEINLTIHQGSQVSATVTISTFYSFLSTICGSLTFTPLLSFLFHLIHLPKCNLSHGYNSKQPSHWPVTQPASASSLPISTCLTTAHRLSSDPMWAL